MLTNEQATYGANLEQVTFVRQALDDIQREIEAKEHACTELTSQYSELLGRYVAETLEKEGKTWCTCCGVVKPKEQVSLVYANFDGRDLSPGPLNIYRACRSCEKRLLAHSGKKLIDASREVDAQLESINRGDYQGWFYVPSTNVFRKKKLVAFRIEEIEGHFYQEGDDERVLLGIDFDGRCFKSSTGTLGVFVTVYGPHGDGSYSKPPKILVDNIAKNLGVVG